MGIIARQSIKGTAVTYVGAFVGFLSTFFIQTQFLKAEEIGLLQVILQAATLVSSFALMGLNSSIFRFYPYFKQEDSENHKDRDKGFLYYILLISIIGLAIVIPCYYLLREPISAIYIKNSPQFVHHFDTVVALTVSLLFWLVFELYAVQLLRIAVPKLIRELLLRILLVGIYLIYAAGWIQFPVLVALFVCCHFVCMILSILYVRRIGSLSLKHQWSDITPTLRRQFIRYTFVYMLGSIGTKFASQLDIFMVASLDSGGMQSAGIFTIAFFMVAIVEIPSRSLLNIASPMMAEAMKRNDIPKANELFKRVSLHQILAGGFIFLCVLINIDNVYAILPNGSLYAAGKWVFIFLGLSKLLEITFNYGNSVVSFSKYYHWNLYYTLGVTIVAFGFNLWLIPQYAITGAAIATLITRVLTYSMQQVVISTQLHCSPFSPRLFALFGLFALALGFNYLLPTLSSPYADAVMRTLIIGIGTIIAVYLCRISPEANALIDKARQKLFKA